MTWLNDVCKAVDYDEMRITEKRLPGIAFFKNFQNFHFSDWPLVLAMENMNYTNKIRIWIWVEPSAEYL